MCLGVPGQIVEISDVAQQRATVELEGVRRDVSVALIGLDGPDGARVGDWVLLHVGSAMAKVDAEARQTLDELASLSDMYEQALTDHFPATEQYQVDRAAGSVAVPRRRHQIIHSHRRAAARE